jgi:hypothetical protein
MTSRLEQIDLLIEKFFTTKINYKIIPNKKNKNQIYIKDGFINYLIDFKNKLVCPCKSNIIGKANYQIYCNHILYFLIEHLKLSSLVISYLNIKEIYQNFPNYINEDKDNLNEILEKDILKYFEKECIICYEKLNKKNNRLDMFICQLCKNELHFTCYRKWINFRQKGLTIEKGCPFCKNKTNNTIF